MRDYRDAKTMAKTLRQALKARSLTLTHAESLELTAQAFGFRDWNGLAARIEADGPAPASGGLLRCSFCGKSQQDVGKLIAGPGSAICDACVGLCDDILLFEQAPSGPGDEPQAALSAEALAGYSTERLIQLKTRAAASIANGRQLLALIASGDFKPRGDDKADPQRAVIARKSPAERQAYADDIARRISAIDSWTATLDALLDQRQAGR